ncbi:MAG: 2-oxoglutarate dehydrogenase E1 component [Polyangia bacterium]
MAPPMSNDILELAQNASFLDDLYEQFLANPASIDPSWRHVFESGELAVYQPPPGNGSNGHANGHTNGHTSDAAVERRAQDYEPRFARVYSLVDAYRKTGHLRAQLDPLGRLARDPHPELEPRNYGFTDADLDRVMPAGGLRGIEDAPLREIIRRLRATFCGPIGTEAMHIPERERRTWIWDRIEPTLNRPNLDRATQLAMFKNLAKAELFEQFVHTKFVGTKRFSLEGGDTLIPMLDLIIERAADAGMEEVVLGMPHRGRLNVLTNIMGKSPGDIFTEFEDVDPETMFGGGDVKYHLGYSSDRETRDGKSIHLSLAFNPSHLEAVDPVVVGRVRAKQRRRGAMAFEKVLGILMHGDAAFAGQGLVAEVLNLQNLRGYRTGGTVHIIVNNQIGFTTVPSDSRSTTYCTDIAKMTGAPIFHVNGEDPEAVAQVVELAMAFRSEFNSDVIIDMYCYRKYGHNEGDEPAFTQPLMYQAIATRPTPRQVYGTSLIERGIITEADAQAIVDKESARLLELYTARPKSRPKVDTLHGVWGGYIGGPDTAVEPDTRVDAATLAMLSDRLAALPDGFHPHPKVAKILEQRIKMGHGEQPLDWGGAEMLGFASIAYGGQVVRMSGQDSRRGTFSHRQACVVDQVDGTEHVPLEHLSETQGRCKIYDSPLSEAGVLGFEYGYSLDYPDGLVLWEAQFGDFVNGAQVIIDQYITSCEDKWQRLSGIVLLLPHGYEGQGPEHSSARFERFLKQCAEDNIQVCQPTTPAQYFHLLRRQALWKWRKPLVVLTPKSLLRLPAARSTLADLTDGKFERILGDDEVDAAGVKRILLCTGKIFYDLVDERKKRESKDVAILRLEQLYPLKQADLVAALGTYGGAREIIWVQDEPVNMGAAHYIYVRLLQIAGARSVDVVSRAESASPATGSHKAHQLEQARILRQAFGPVEELG